MKLKAELPMTGAMYLNLVNNYVKTTPACSSCRHHNGECVDFAKAGTCNAMDKKINEVLVFHDGETEFATTRPIIAHALESDQKIIGNMWVGKSVNEVIEAYRLEGTFEKENSQAFALLLLLNLDDILAEEYHCQ